MKLPEFTGDILKWNNFWETFEYNINSKNIAPIQKLTYLLSCLKGQPKEYVSGYTIIGRNYDIIVRLLKERYGREDLIRHKLIAELRNLPKINDDTSKLREFSTNIDRICMQLENMGEETNNNNIMQSIECKLNYKLITNIYSKKKKK